MTFMGSVIHLHTQRTSLCKMTSCSPTGWDEFTLHLSAADILPIVCIFLCFKHLSRGYHHPCSFLQSHRYLFFGISQVKKWIPVFICQTLSHAVSISQPPTGAKAFASLFVCACTFRLVSRTWLLVWCFFALGFSQSLKGTCKHLKRLSDIQTYWQTDRDLCFPPDL